MTEDIAEIGIDLACLSCLEHIGLDPYVSLLIVLGSSTAIRLAVDWLRTKKATKTEGDKTKKS